MEIKKLPKLLENRREKDCAETTASHLKNQSFLIKQNLKTMVKHFNNQFRKVECMVHGKTQEIADRCLVELDYGQVDGKKAFVCGEDKDEQHLEVKVKLSTVNVNYSAAASSLINRVANSSTSSSYSLSSFGNQESETYLALVMTNYIFGDPDSFRLPNSKPWVT